VRWLVLAIAVAAPALAVAQPNPTFAYRKEDDVKEVPDVEWTAAAELGFVVTTGNSETTTITASGKVGRRAGKNKLEISTSLAYARASTRGAIDRDGNGTIGPGEIVGDTKITAETFEGKLRYDRYLDDKNSLYIAALARRDRPAGKELLAGGQVGYSRVLKKTETAEAVAEVGYDLSYENVIAPGDGVFIHSARAFVGFKGKASDENAYEASLEYLTNVAGVDSATGRVGVAGDNRINAHAQWSSKIGADLSLAFTFDLKFDSAPSPLAISGVTFDPGFVPESSSVDSLFKGSIIYTFF
jgi:hypothetical protein